MDNKRTVEISENIYWVGAALHQGGLHCNPYLIVDGDEAILIDPGSVLDFEYVYDNVTSIVPLEKIKYVVLHHQDPDFCSSVPLFEQKGANFKIITHWRTRELVKFYGIKSEYYIVNEHEFRLVLHSGRVLDFIQTPYLHFPGAITTYDNTTKILFSSDLFGAFSHEWKLYADDDYIDKMKTFHEHYMPSNDIIRPVMEFLSSMDIKMIAPQHGSIIKNDIQGHIRVLKELECGSFISPVKKNLVKIGEYRTVCHAVLKRYEAIFSKDQVLAAIKGLDIEIDQNNLEIIDYNSTGVMLWNNLFERILSVHGLQWLIVIEPLVKSLSKEYDVSMPGVFETSLKRAAEETLQLDKENQRLRDINQKLENSMQEAREKLIKCPVTSLYNYEFFRSYLVSALDGVVDEKTKVNPVLVVISVDNLAKIKFSYGDNEVDEVLKNIVYCIKTITSDRDILFRLQGASFACFVPDADKEAVVSFAERIRNTIYDSDMFIEKVTVSIGVVSQEEIIRVGIFSRSISEEIYDVALMRVKLAKQMGMNLVCSNSSIGEYQDEIGRILVVDDDSVNVDILKTFLENLDFKVFTAADGVEALRISEENSVDLIISEIMIPKIDGFLVRERLLASSNTKNIPFIIVSHLKDEASIERAASLGIQNYFKKPFMLSEIIGVIKNKFKGETYQ